MTHTIFLAGAAGAIGRRLVPLLVHAGHRIYGTTRFTHRAARIGSQGATPVVVDVFDADALARTVARLGPDVVIHQLTDLPPGLDPARMPDAIVRNARLREVGTRNLVAAAVGAGARRLIAQSICWAYAPGPQPYDESAPLDVSAPDPRGISVRGVAALERSVLENRAIQGVVLRYGHLYGPGTGADHPRGADSVHVDAAAHAALLAVDRDVVGAYNVVEPNDVVNAAKAKRELGWDCAFRVTQCDVTTPAPRRATS